VLRGNRALLAPSFTTLCALLVYGLTLAPDLTWANFGTDGGELITAAVTLGVPHPPGYPTYVLLGKLASLIPIGTVAYRFNLFSAVCISLAAGLVTGIVRGEKETSAIAVGLSLAFAPLVWGQAVITEVYGLNLVMVALFIWALGDKRPSLLTGSLFGLCLTTHLTAVLLLPLAIGLTPRRQWWRFFLGVPLGLLPLLAIPLLAGSGSPVVWGEPATWDGWWWLVSGALYRFNLFTADWQARLLPWSQILFSQFTWAGLPLILFSLLAPRSSLLAPRFSPPTPLLLFTTALLYFLYALTYNTNDALVLLLPAVLLLSLLLAPGLRRLGRYALLLPLISLLLNFEGQNMRKAQTIRPLASQHLQAAPPDAILFMSGEGSLFALWYFQHVEGQRPDLILLDENLFAFDWRRRQLQNQYPDVAWPETYDLEAVIREAERPICYLELLNEMTCQ
jgi:hypothetical protein